MDTVYDLSIQSIEDMEEKSRLQGIPSQGEDNCEFSAVRRIIQSRGIDNHKNLLWMNSSYTVKTVDTSTLEQKDIDGFWVNYRGESNLGVLLTANPPFTQVAGVGQSTTSPPQQYIHISPSPISSVQISTIVSGENTAVQSIVYSRYDKIVLLGTKGDGEGRVIAVDTDDKIETICSVSVPLQSVLCIDIAPDTDIILAGGYGGVVMLFFDGRSLHILGKIIDTQTIAEDSVFDIRTNNTKAYCLLQPSGNTAIIDLSLLYPGSSQTNPPHTVPLPESPPTPTTPTLTPATASPPTLSSLSLSLQSALASPQTVIPLPGTASFVKVVDDTVLVAIDGMLHLVNVQSNRVTPQSIPFHIGTLHSSHLLALTPSPPTLYTLSPTDTLSPAGPIPLPSTAIPTLPSPDDPGVCLFPSPHSSLLILDMDTLSMDKIDGYYDNIDKIIAVATGLGGRIICSLCIEDAKGAEDDGSHHCLLFHADTNDKYPGNRLPSKVSLNTLHRGSRRGLGLQISTTGDLAWILLQTEYLYTIVVISLDGKFTVVAKCDVRALSASESQAEGTASPVLLKARGTDIFYVVHPISHGAHEISAYTMQEDKIYLLASSSDPQSVDSPLSHSLQKVVADAGSGILAVGMKGPLGHTLAIYSPH